MIALYFHKIDEVKRSTRIPSLSLKYKCELKYK